MSISRDEDNSQSCHLPDTRTTRSAIHCRVETHSRNGIKKEEWGADKKKRTGKKGRKKKASRRKQHEGRKLLKGVIYSRLLPLFNFYTNSAFVITVITLIFLSCCKWKRKKRTLNLKSMEIVRCDTNTLQGNEFITLHFLPIFVHGQVKNMGEGIKSNYRNSASNAWLEYLHFKKN